MEENQTSAHIRQKRRAILQERRRRRLRVIAWYGLLAEVFLLPLSPGAATFALLVASLATGLRLWKDESFSFRHLPFDVPAILFVVISALSVLASPNRAFSFYNYYNLVGVYVLTYLLVGQNVRQAHQMKTILRVAGVSAVLVILYGYYQFLFGIDISSMKWVDGDAFPELRKRVFSTWENPNILAGYLDIVICLAFGLFMHAGTRRKRMMFGAFMLAAAACLAMTYARGACLVIAVILAGYGALKDRRVLLACLIVGALLLAVDPVLYERLTSVFTKVDTSTEMRLAFWESTVAMIQDHPFLGIGWGAYWLVYPEYDFYLQGADVLIVHAHNIYLNYMAEIGIPGAVAFFWFFFGTMFLALHLPFAGAEKTEEQRLLRGLSLGLGLAVLSVALNGLTDDLLFNIPSSMVLWMMAAFIGALSFLSQPDPAGSSCCFHLPRETMRAVVSKASILWQQKDTGEKSMAEKEENTEKTTPSAEKTEAPVPGTPEVTEKTPKKQPGQVEETEHPGSMTLSADDIAELVKEATALPNHSPAPEMTAGEEPAGEPARKNEAEEASEEEAAEEPAASPGENTETPVKAAPAQVQDMDDGTAAPADAEPADKEAKAGEAGKNLDPQADADNDNDADLPLKQQASHDQDKQEADSHEGTDKHIKSDN